MSANRRRYEHRFNEPMDPRKLSEVLNHLARLQHRTNAKEWRGHAPRTVVCTSVEARRHSAYELNLDLELKLVDPAKNDAPMLDFNDWDAYLCILGLRGVRSWGPGDSPPPESTDVIS